MTSFYKSGAMLASLVLLTACGGGSSSTTITTGSTSTTSISIDGTAATGAAISGATVSAKCAVGTGAATTQSKGTYLIQIANGQFPCILQVSNPLDLTKLHSLALSAASATQATANLTPLTEMATARVLGTSSGVFFAAFDPAALKQRATSTTLTSAQTDVLTVLGGVLDTTNASNFMSAALVAATASSAGNAQDQFLDALKTKLTFTQVTALGDSLAKGESASTVKQAAVTLATSNTTPPTARAGSEQNVVAGSTVTLDGSTSTDANGDTLTYAWTLTSKPSGSAAALSSATSAKPTFVADMTGNYVATLTVNDGKTTSSPSSVIVTAAAATVNVAPVANAGTAQSVLAGTTVTLDGSTSTDANGDALTYAWTLSDKPTGSTAALNSATSAKPTFVADAGGTYVAILVVSDGKLASAAKTVLVTASASSSANVAPVANAGTAQSVLAGATITLDGSASSDANGDTLTYAWTLTSKPTGSGAALSSATATKPTFAADVAGTYVATLVVSDGKLASTASTVSVTAAVPSSNVAPVANAGTAQSVLTGATVTLNGSASSDANGDTLTYAWTLTSKPSGSSAALSSATASKPTFVADAAGTYVATLVVNDGKLASTSTTVAVTATASATSANVAPVAKITYTPSAVYAGSSTVQLDGSGSTDANNDKLTYSWSLLSKPASSTAALSTADTEKPTFRPDVTGFYEVTLEVSDGKLTNSSTVSVAVKQNSINTPPIADAGAPATGETLKAVVGDKVTLDASASKDVDGDTLTYKWKLEASPTGSTATLSDTTAVKPTFVADVAGDYWLSLVVNDGRADSTPVMVLGGTDGKTLVSNGREKVGVTVKTGTPISGVISYESNGYGSWTTAGSPYYLTGETTIPDGFTLSVGAGVEIYGNKHNFIVAGTLDIKGTAASMTTVTDANFIPSGTKHAFKIAYATIKGGKLYPTASGNGILELTDSIVSGSSEKIYLFNPVGGSHKLERNSFSKYGGISFQLTDGSLSIKNNFFKEWTTASAIENRGMQSGSFLAVTGNTFGSVGINAVSLTSGYVATDMDATNNYWGTTDTSTIDSMITDKKDGINNKAVLYSPPLTAPAAATPTK